MSAIFVSANHEVRDILQKITKVGEADQRIDDRYLNISYMMYQEFNSVVQRINNSKGLAPTMSEYNIKSIIFSALQYDMRPVAKTVDVIFEHLWSKTPEQKLLNALVQFYRDAIHISKALKHTKRAPAIPISEDIHMAIDEWLASAFKLFQTSKISKEYLILTKDFAEEVKQGKWSQITFLQKASEQIDNIGRIYGIDIDQIKSIVKGAQK